MKTPKSFLFALTVLGLSSALYSVGSLKVWKQEEEKKHQGKQLEKVMQELAETRKISFNYESLEKRFLKARNLGILHKSNRQKLFAVLDALSLESGLDSLSYEAELSEGTVLLDFPCRWTRITLHIEHIQDTDIFRFIRALSHKIPGTIIPEQFSLIRNETGTVSGSYHFYLLTLENGSP